MLLTIQLIKLWIQFCHLMDMCLGDQQSVTLLLYLDDICVFAANVDEMLDHTDMVFARLKELNLKIKPKHCHFFWYSSFWRVCHICRRYLCKPKKIDKVKNWPVPTNLKDLHSFLGLVSYYCWFIPNCNYYMLAMTTWSDK